MKHLIYVVLLAVGLLFCTAISASAYLDPSAMTYVIQVAAGVVIAGGAAVAIYWKKIRLFFKNRKKNKNKNKKKDSE